MELSFPLFAGIIAAVLHVISGPDHLAAVTPFAIESKKKAWKVGLFWGIGHLTGMLFIGILFLIFKEFIPIEKISEYSEKLVGVVLIILGIWIFVRIFWEEKHHRFTNTHIYIIQKKHIITSIQI
jgi:cytochrome c biogenesis protein CcdA